MINESRVREFPINPSYTSEVKKNHTLGLKYNFYKVRKAYHLQLIKSLIRLIVSIQNVVII